MAKQEKKIGDFTALGQEAKLDDGSSIRPEVRVNVVSGIIKKIEEGSKGTHKVAIAVPGMKYDFAGYIGEKASVFPLLKKAYDEGIVVVVRFEQKRKKGVELSTPIKELTASMDVARESTIKTCVGIWSDADGKWILTDEAQSNPSEDPDTIIRGIEAVDDNINPDSFFAAPPQASAQPTVQYGFNKNQDAGVNSLLNVYVFVKEQEKANEFTLDEATRRRVATTLWNACNTLQKRMYHMAEADPAAYSHTRARFLLFSYCQHICPLDKEAIKNFKEWGATMLEATTELWKWGFESWDKFTQA